MDKKATEELVAEYRADIIKLAKYIPCWKLKAVKMFPLLFRERELQSILSRSRFMTER